MKKTLLLTTIACIALQMQAQRLYVQYKFNPELQTLLANPDKKALYETYAAQPINATDRAEYTAVQLRFTDDTGTQELARYSLSPSRLEQLWSSLYDAGKLPFVSTEEEFIDLNDPHFVGLTAQSFDIISRLTDQLAALPIDERLATIDNFLHNEFECNRAKYTSLLSLTLQLIKALDVMGTITLQQEIATLTFTREYLDFHSDCPERLSNMCQAALRQAYIRHVLWQNAHLISRINTIRPFFVKFSPNQHSIVLYPQDNNISNAIYVLNTVNDPTLNHAREVIFDEKIRAVCFSPDSKRLAVASDTVSIWKLTQDDRIIEQEYILSLNGIAIETESVKFSPDGRFILASSKNTGDICIWNLSLGPNINNPRFVRTFHVSDDLEELEIWKAVFSHDGKLAAAGITDEEINQVYVFDLANPNIADEPHNWRILDCSDDTSIDSIHFSPSNRFVIVRTTTNLFIFDLSKIITDEPQSPQWTFANIKWRSHCLFFSPGEQYITTIKGNLVRTYDLKNPYLARTYAAQQANILPNGTENMHVRTNPYHSISSIIGDKVLIWGTIHGEHFNQLAQLTVDNPATKEFRPRAQISPFGNYICATVDNNAYFWRIDQELEALTDKQKLFMLIAKITPDTCLDDACTTYWKSVYDTLPVIAQRLLSSQIRNSFEHQSTDTHTSDKLHEQQLTDSFLLAAMKYARKDVDSTIGTGEFWQSEIPAKQRKKYGDKISSQEADTMINAFFDSKASTSKKADASNLTIMQEQMADLIKRKNFEAAEMLFEKYQKDIRASTRYAEFAQAIAEWRARNGRAGSSSSSSTDR